MSFISLVCTNSRYISRYYRQQTWKTWSYSSPKGGIKRGLHDGSAMIQLLHVSLMTKTTWVQQSLKTLKLHDKTFTFQNTMANG